MFLLLRNCRLFFHNHEFHSYIYDDQTLNQLDRQTFCDRDIQMNDITLRFFGYTKNDILRGCNAYRGYIILS